MSTIQALTAALALVAFVSTSPAYADDTWDPKFSIFVGLADVGSNTPGTVGMVLGPVAAVGYYAKAERSYAKALRAYRKYRSAENRRDLEEAAIDYGFSGASVVASVPVPGFGLVGVPGNVYYLGKALDKGDFVTAGCRTADIIAAAPQVGGGVLTAIGIGCSTKSFFEENGTSFTDTRTRSKAARSAWGPCQAFNQGC